MMEWLLVAIGLVILLLGGDVLVRGAVNLSLRLGVPALIVSLSRSMEPWIRVRGPPRRWTRSAPSRKAPLVR